MERRDVLKLGLAAGVGLALEKIPGSEALADSTARATTAKFYLAELSGDMEGWYIVFTIVAARVTAFAHHPAGDGEILGFVGPISGGDMTLDGRDPDDPATNAATFTGRLTRNTITGQIELANAAGGTEVRAKVIKKDAKQMKKLAGQYEGALVSNTNPFAGTTANAILRSNGTFEVFEGERPNGNPIAGRLPGFYVVRSKSKEVFVAFLPPASGARPAGYSPSEFCKECPGFVRFLFYGLPGVYTPGRSLRISPSERRFRAQEERMAAFIAAGKLRH